VMILCRRAKEGRPSTLRVAVLKFMAVSPVVLS
jgi:hypothetical protein